MSNAQWAIIRKISNKPLMDIFNLVFSRTILNNATKYVISRLRTIEAKSQCENAPLNCRDWVIIEVTLTKDFLGLSRAVNREPPPNPADSTESKNLPIKSIIQATRLGKKQAGKEETKVSCRFFINATVLSVCRELPCFPSNFVCADALSTFFPLVIFRPSFCTMDYFECILSVTQAFLLRGLEPDIFLERKFTEFGAIKTRVQSLVRLQIKSRREKGWVGENALAQVKAERIQFLEIGIREPMTFLNGIVSSL